MTRKRQRPNSMLLLGLLPCALSFQSVPSPLNRGGSSFLVKEEQLPRRRAQRVITFGASSATGGTRSASLIVRRKENKDSPRSDSSPRSAKTKDLPPWLSHYDQFSLTQVKEQIQWLEYTLMEQGFLVADITQVVTAVDQIAAQDTEMAAGLLDFLRLLLSLRQQGDENGALFVTTPVLLASIVHYADCVAARRNGMSSVLREALLRQVTPQNHQSAQLPGLELTMETVSPCPVLACAPPTPLGMTPAPVLSSSEEQQQSCPYEPQVRIITHGAARVKRAESLAHAVLQNHVITSTQAARLRDFYLMCMEQDWRSLAIRVVACLYRLEGLLRTEASDFGQPKSPQAVQTAREAMRIYAPLAQRLGMHRLKAMLEERAFRLQYRRQYRAVSALYHETGEAMQSVSAYLQTNLRQILQNDDALVGQLQTLQIASRVKEPYSFWRKLLNQKVKGLLKPAAVAENNKDKRTLSVTQVNDAVALRVILTARKLSPEEPDDITRAREQMLCYYVQHLIRAHWPETDVSRLKDYIAHPKKNGYQSLHHTSQIASRGIKFPFEVQVRSAEMHAQAEFGVSAHWDYKLAGEVDKSLKSAAPPMELPPQDLSEAMTALANQEWDELSSMTVDNPSSPASTVEVDGYVDALVTAKEDMLKNQIYVFIMGDGNEQGELISVPSNSSIGDAVVEIEDILPAKVQVWKNGRLASTSDKLENGDVMMIAV